MAKVGVVLAALTAFALSANAQAVTVDSSVAKALDSLARDSIEHVACLYGHSAPDTFYLTAYGLPAQIPIGTHNVVGHAGDCWSALAHWHNHPVPKDSVAESYLYYSLTDEHTFTRTTNTPLAIVGVPGAWCIWTRQQVLDGYLRNLTPLPPYPRQCIKLP